MKKNILIVCSVVAVGLFNSCAEKEGQYIDLGTGKSINVVMDEKTGAMVNADTKDPLYIYVDTKKHDTIYAINGAVINGHVIKNGEDKVKIDGKTGERKTKKDD